MSADGAGAFRGADADRKDDAGVEAKPNGESLRTGVGTLPDRAIISRCIARCSGEREAFRTPTPYASQAHASEAKVEDRWRIREARCNDSKRLHRLWSRTVLTRTLTSTYFLKASGPQHDEPLNIVADLSGLP